MCMLLCLSSTTALLSDITYSADRFTHGPAVPSHELLDWPWYGPEPKPKPIHFPAKLSLCTNIRKFEVQFWPEDNEMVQWALKALVKFPKLYEFRVRIELSKKDVAGDILQQLKKFNEELRHTLLKYDRYTEDEGYITIVWNDYGNGGFCYEF